MSLLNREAFTGSRPGATTVVSGRHVAGTPVAFSFTGNAQPVEGDDLDHRPAGDINLERLALYTKAELFLRDEITRTSTEKKYQVESIEDWTKQGLTVTTQHFRAIIVLKEDQ